MEYNSLMEGLLPWQQGSTDAHRLLTPFGQAPAQPIPTPPNDYAARTGELPPDYYHNQTLWQGADPAAKQRYNQLLQLMYMHKAMRT